VNITTPDGHDLSGFGMLVVLAVLFIPALIGYFIASRAEDKWEKEAEEFVDEWFDDRDRQHARAYRAQWQQQQAPPQQSPITLSQGRDGTYR